jgi:hypothetical protein
MSFITEREFFPKGWVFCENVPLPAYRGYALAMLSHTEPRKYLKNQLWRKVHDG